MEGLLSVEPDDETPVNITCKSSKQCPKGAIPLVNSMCSTEIVLHSEFHEVCGPSRKKD